MRVAALYAQQYDIFLRDRYLFHQPQEDPLRSKLGSKRRFLEKAKFLFEESAKMARKGQQYIHKFFPRKKTAHHRHPHNPWFWGGQPNNHKHKPVFTLSSQVTGQRDWMTQHHASLALLLSSPLCTTPHINSRSIESHHTTHPAWQRQKSIQMLRWDQEG